MAILLHDLAGLLLATLLMPLLGLLPGLALVRLLERCGVAGGTGWARFGWSLLLAIALLPAIDALAIRWVGLPVTIAAHFGLAAAALPGLRWPGGPPPRAIWFMPLWWLIVAFDFIDVGTASGLHQTLLSIDLVKHAAVTETIAQHGLPLVDPFFARTGPAGYYYYFYIQPAMVRRLGGGAIEARMAFAAAAFWTGLAVPGLAWRIAVDAGFVRAGSARRLFAIISGLCFVAGTDLPFMLARCALAGTLNAQIEWWTEYAGLALPSLLWAPHHVAASIAAWVAALLVMSVEAATGGTVIAIVLTAGAAFATTFGVSVWIAITAAPIFLIWAVVSAVSGPRRVAPMLAAAALVALALAIPQIRDVLTNRADGGVPITVWVRRFAFLDMRTMPALAPVLLVLLPVGYLASFGGLALGSMTFLRGHGIGRDPLARLLTISAIVALLVASFVRSTIINNDLGWRALLFVAEAMLVWTGVLLERAGRPSRLTLGLLALGVAGSAWDVIGLRLIRPPRFQTVWPEFNASPATDLSERDGYRWAARHLPPATVIQHDPVLHLRAYDFGLYGRNRTGVADVQAMLFGASPQAVAARIAALGPVFTGPLAPAQIVSAARSQGIDMLMFADLDPVWRRRGGPPLPCIWRDAHVCLAAVR